MHVPDTMTVTMQPAGKGPVHLEFDVRQRLLRRGARLTVRQCSDADSRTGRQRRPVAAAPRGERQPRPPRPSEELLIRTTRRSTCRTSSIACAAARNRSARSTSGTVQPRPARWPSPRIASSARCAGTLRRKTLSERYGLPRIFEKRAGAGCRRAAQRLTPPHGFMACLPPQVSRPGKPFAAGQPAWFPDS